MPKELTLKVEADHVESLTRANGTNALSELIWNSLDADATEIRINFKKNGLGGYEYITVDDNGHGVSYRRAENTFQNLGGSQKKLDQFSPAGRIYHGQEGKGRYKALALGDLVTFESTYMENGQTKTFSVTLDKNNLGRPVISDLKNHKGLKPTCFKIKIFNVDNKAADNALSDSSIIDYQEKFANYYISYPHFAIFINNKRVDFNNLRKDFFEYDYGNIEIDEQKYKFTIKVVEWNFDCKKRTYFCNEKGIPYKDIPLGIRSSLPISIFIQSDYIAKLHGDNTLLLSELDEYLEVVFHEAKKIAREYVRERLHFYSREFINELKRDKIYPYTEETTEKVEIAKRQVFDIVALQINEYLPTFSEQEIASKKLTLSLIKEALENDTSALQRILSEVVGLPDEKKDELAEILEKTSLVTIIDTMREITDRLTFLHSLEQLVYDPDYSKNILERKHLHKIVAKESWIFGDEYTYGADDITLKNVLKQYLKYLDREDFEEIIDSGNNEELTTIPDICLWKQFSTGVGSSYVNLVIELKKPSVDAGFDQLKQIQSYAQKVAKDSRFAIEKTKWVFILLTRKIKDEIETQVTQEGRDYGLVTQGKNFDVWVLPWGTIITKAKLRYQYVKEKLNITFTDNQDAVKLLHTKYKEYLPSEEE